MSKHEIPYINLIIRTFAERFQMSRHAAYAIANDLQDVYLDQQICFATPRSLEYLKKQSVCLL